MTFLLLLMASFATYRVARMLAQEDGPFDVFARVRGRVNQRTWVGRGIACVWCLSFWVALVVACGLAWQGHLAWRDVWLVWLAIAGASAAIYQVVR